MGTFIIRIVDEIRTSSLLHVVSSICTMAQPSWRAIVAFVFAATHIALGAFPDCANGPLKDNLVCNTSADPVSRAKALVNELTLEEMANNTVNAAFGVPRLGLPAYNWWSEALVRTPIVPPCSSEERSSLPCSSSFSTASRLVLAPASPLLASRSALRLPSRSLLSSVRVLTMNS